MTSYSTSSEWFGFFGPSGEPQQDVSPSKETTAASTTSRGSSGEKPIEWPLDDIMNDIEQQMNEQNDHLAGMTKQIEDIEQSLAQHNSSSSRSKRSVVKKKSSTYVQMSDDEEDSLGGELEPQPTVGKPSILRVLKKRASQVVRGNSHDEEDDKDRPLSRADPGSRYDLEEASTTSSSTKRANNSTRRSSVESSSDLTPPRDTQHSRRHLKLHPIPSKLPTQQQELPPPSPAVNGSGTNSRGQASVNFNLTPTVLVDEGHKRKSLRSSTTWEESDSSSNPDSDDVSELENTTISGNKTWITLRGSRKAKLALLLLSFALVLMIGLLMDQWAQGRDAKAAQSQQNQQAPLVGSPATPGPPATVAPAEASGDASPETVTTPAPDLATSQPTAFSGSVVPDDSVDENEDDGSEVVPQYDYRQNTDYLVGVYYYPWHKNDFHNGDGYMRRDLTPQHQPGT